MNHSSTSSFHNIYWASKQYLKNKIILFIWRTLISDFPFQLHSNIFFVLSVGVDVAKFWKSIGIQFLNSFVKLVNQDIATHNVASQYFLCFQPPSRRSKVQDTEQRPKILEVQIRSTSKRKRKRKRKRENLERFVPQANEALQVPPCCFHFRFRFFLRLIWITFYRWTILSEYQTC